MYFNVGMARAASFVVACVLLVPGVAPSGALASVPASQSQVTKPETAPGLLTWKDCRGPKGAQCADLAVSGLETGTWQIPIIRLPATGDRIGVLFANPGGPGISGVAYLQDWGNTLSTLRRSFDIVSFDPPGVAESVPDTKCLTDQQKTAIRDQPSAPRTSSERATAQRLGALIGEECKARLGPALADVSTLNAAAVMDAIREALGEPRIAYLGFSYGTLLGAVYADRYPDRAWRFVLDGAMDPSLNYDGVRRDQAVALDMATRRFIRDCPRHANCALTGDPDRDMRTLQELVARLDDKPFRKGGRVLSGSRALNLIQSSMYYPPYGWKVLRQVLQPALEEGDLGPFLKAAYSPDNMVNPADPEYLSVVCEDLATSRDPESTAAKARAWSRLAPLNGASRAWSTAPCTFWPTRQAALPARLSARGSGPILVVGTRYDPATPVKWSRNLAGMLSNAGYVEWKGDGHLGYDGERGGPCVARAVEALLLQGRLPAKRVSCPAG